MQPGPPNPNVYTGQIVLGFPEKVEPLQNAPMGIKIKTIIMTIVGAVVIGGILVGVGFAGDQGWLKWTGYIIGGIIFIAAFFMGKGAKVAPCPYCGHMLGKTVDDGLQMNDEDERIPCPNCQEWSISHEGQLRAFTQEDADRLDKKFRAPVFENGVWPNECLTCGQPATRGDDLKTANVSGLKLLLGRISVSSAKVFNVPYCHRHTEDVKLIIREQEPRLEFKDYQARRRYIALNRGKKKVT